MLIIYSDKIVLQDKIEKGYIVIQDNIIKSIQKDIKEDEKKYVIDYTGSYIMPGIVNINSKNLDTKKIFTMSYDDFIRRLKNIEYYYASFGVSTMYHNVYFTEDTIQKESEIENTSKIIKWIKNYDELPISIVDNKTHLKFQINSAKTMDDVKYLLDAEKVDFVSYDIKDNRRNINMYKDQYMQSFIQTNLNLSEDIADKVIDRIRQLRDESNIEELAYLVKYAHFKGVKVCTSEYSSASKIYNDFKDTTDIIKITSQNDDIPMEKDIYFKLLRTSKILENKDYSKIDESSILSSDKKPSELLECLSILMEKIPMYEISKLLSKNPAKALGLESLGQIKEGYIGIGLWKIYCCAIDMTLVGYPVKSDGKMEEGKWYDLKGKIQIENGEPYIQYIEAKQVEEPKENQVY